MKVLPEVKEKQVFDKYPALEWGVCSSDETRNLATYTPPSLATYTLFQ